MIIIIIVIIIIIIVVIIIITRVAHYHLQVTDRSQALECMRRSLVADV
jgi:hypothetical protein